MSYIERIRGPQQTNVVPINGAVSRHVTEGVHPYAAAIRLAWLDRLDTLASRPWRQGDAWDTNCFVTARKLIEVANSPWAGYTHADARNDYFAHAPRDQAWDQREKCWIQAEKVSSAAMLPEPAPGDEWVIPTPTVLDDAPELDADEEDAFWAERPLLAHVHTFARARMVAPWAALGCVLARIITATPHQVCLPPIVGGKASLNLFVGLVGPSGSGKGAAEAVAHEALETGYIESHNVGSGEGIAHGYKHREKGQLVWNDDQHAVLFSVPEIDSLAAQGDRRGATLMPQLRSGWTGEQLGFGYADPMKRIIVEAHQYRLCLVAGIQPGRAGCLLNDSDGGTPQRFLWMPATDPHAPDEEPAAPPPLRWNAPPVSNLVGIGGIHIDVCDTARQTIKGARRARNRGDGEALDGHALLAQLKTAAALGIAEGRYSVTEDDWRLAGVVSKKSAATRATVVRYLAQKVEQANIGRALGEAERAVVVAEKVADVAVRRVCGAVVRKLTREPGWQALTTVKRAVAARDREHVETALDRLLDADQIEVEEASRDTSGHGGKGTRIRLKGKR